VTAEPLPEHRISISQTLKWLSKQVFQKFGQPIRKTTKIW